MVLTRSNVRRKATVRNSLCWQSPHSALGRTQMTKGARKPSGIGSLCSGHFWQSVSLRLSRSALTYSSKALSSDRPTNNRTAKARSRRPPRLRRGQSAPMSCAGLIAVNQSPTRPLPRKRRSPTKRRSDVFDTKALRRCRRAFFIFVLTISPPLRFESALCPVAEEPLGRQVSEHLRRGSATIQAQIHHRQALLTPHRSVGFLCACAASCSCLQEEPSSSNPLAHTHSISHTPYGAGIDRRSHKCSSRGRDRKTSTPPQHRLRFVPFTDRSALRSY